MPLCSASHTLVCFFLTKYHLTNDKEKWVWELTGICRNLNRGPYAGE